MRFGTHILIFAIFLLVELGRPVPAHAAGLTFWDQDIATAINNAVTSDDACRSSPYALYRQTCVGNELNVTLERSPFERLTFLDHIALFVNKHRNLAATQQIMKGIRFKVGVDLTHVYQQEAKVEARLRVRW